MSDLARQFEPVNAAIAALAMRLDEMEDRLPDEIGLQAQLDRIEAAATSVAGRMMSRWAAFTDDELETLATWSDQAAEWTPENCQAESKASRPLIAEVIAELERRRS